MDKSKVEWIETDSDRNTLVICRSRGAYIPPRPWHLPRDPFFVGSVVVRPYAMTPDRWSRLWCAMATLDIEYYARGSVTMYFTNNEKEDEDE